MARPLIPTRHAIERYQERVAPALDLEAAETQLGQLLAMAPLSSTPPDWYTDRPTARYALLSDGVAGVVEGRRVTTVVVRASRSPEVLERRREAKRYQQRRRLGRNRRSGRDDQPMKELR